ncbi:Chain length determinant protein [Anatilimnocola aggregata]|uniref:Chain length determinant protein n=1 Tax=Anatilimnocola aggregata TaxID=2528021 RepID=A0A517YAS2_9BACT|nr:GumC family protein [Anatilimnocola aggregata]QDU27335.1 Chain length determinant protein [Anatilimnocola aggregata]
MIEPQAIWQTLDFVKQALWRHRTLAIGTTFCLLGLTTIGVLMLPKSYLSEAKLFVRFGRENQLDPTASTGQAISINETRESEINSLQEILRSRAMLDRVVSELGPQYILEGKDLGPEVKVTTVGNDRSTTRSEGNEYTSQETSEGTPSRAHQLAVQKLEKDLEIFSPRKTTIIAVRAKAKNPEIAQRIVSKLVETYLDEHVRVHRTPGSFEFFESQTNSFQDQWKLAANDLQKFKTTMGIVTIDGKRTQLQLQISDLEQRLLAAESEVTSSEARIVSLKSAIRLLPEFIASQKVQQPSVAMEGMKQTLFQLQSREQELRSKMTPNHPMVIAVQHQMEDLQQILGEHDVNSVQQTHVINPARQTLELDLLKEQSQVDSLAGRIASLKSQQAAFYVALGELNTDEVKLANLQRDMDLAENRYRSYSEKLEQARINRSLDEERISSLSIFQPATYAIQPQGPRKLMIIALGGFVAIGGGLILALAMAWFNPVLLSAELIQRQLQLPVLGTVAMH